MSSSERFNQKQRTRDAIVDAAGELARQGRSLAIAEVAEAARVSPATAYRYFPNPQALWEEVANLNAGALSVDTTLDGAPAEPAARIDHVIATVADAQLADEATWRAIMRAALERWFTQADLPEADRLPIRGSHRLTMAQEALAPLSDALPPELHRKLTMSVLLVFGVEAMIAARDACGLQPDEAKDVMRWAAQALIQAALAQAADQGADQGAPEPLGARHRHPQAGRTT
ncbi:TetR/AcrR family transcriptional regulator [Actinomadura sp. 9N215]|uniref:TetR/AcrR family transcriptional regulator n=1 Tax=Actinomadura sp. 9N215 TaxID=3375150 RepID=UPI00378B1812